MSSSSASNENKISSARKVIVPVLVKVLDLNDNAPKFTQQTYTAQVDELTPIDSVILDSIQAIDLDSANNGLVEYSLVSSPSPTTFAPKQTWPPTSVGTTSSTLVPSFAVRPIHQYQQQQQRARSPVDHSSYTANTVPAVQLSTAAAPSVAPQQLLTTTTSTTTTSEPHLIATSSDKHVSPLDGATINLNSEPIINGPMDESDEDESDESLLAALNSTANLNVALNGANDSSPTTDLSSDSMSLMMFEPTRARRRRRHSESQFFTTTTSNNFINNQRRGFKSAFTTFTAFNQIPESVATTTPTLMPLMMPKDSLWTNLMATEEQPMVLISGKQIQVPSKQQQDYNFAMSAPMFESSSNEYFSLELAPGSSRPIIKLKKQLDYETKRVHVLTVQASDKANNKSDRLTSQVQVIIKLLDGDDQGPAFVLDQTGCATSSLAHTTISSLSTSSESVRAKRKRHATDELSSTTTTTTTLTPTSSSSSTPVFEEKPTTTTSTTTTKSTSVSPTSAPVVSVTTTTSSQSNVPKGFRISDENFEFGDMTSAGDDLPFSDNNTEHEHEVELEGTKPNESTNEGDDEDESNNNNTNTNNTNESNEKKLLKLLLDPAAAPSSGGRARRFMTTLTPPGGGREQQQQLHTQYKQVASKAMAPNNAYDYSCLANSPLSSFSGQTPEYYSTVMSGESDYVLRIAPQAIKARDRDELNAPIRYSFINGTPANYSLYFHINALDGTVKQIAPVDRSLVGKFVLWVQAQEQTVNKYSSLAKFTIDIIPTDKNPPVLVPNSYAGYVDENSPIGTLISVPTNPNSSETTGMQQQHLRISVIDADYSSAPKRTTTSTSNNNNDRRNAQLYEFETTSDAFKVNKDGYVYVNKWPLDRDLPNPMQAVHMFQVTARQLGLASMSARSISSPVSINVTLLDLNDNAPVIANSSLVPIQLVAGDNRPSRVVTTIRAIDSDLAENARKWFSIHHVSNNGKERFKINEETGELEALGKFNAGEQFSLTLQVSDELQRTNQGIVEVVVAPGPNTSGPQFVFDPDSLAGGGGLGAMGAVAAAAGSLQHSRYTGTGYSVEVNEGIAVNSAVLQLQARDPENDPISFSIIDGNINNDFYINSKTGTIYVANKLDREEVSAYNLLVQARDSGGLASNRPVYIQVADNNDQNPVFNQTHYLFSCFEGQANQVLGRVLATDSDSGDNGRISYHLESPPGGATGTGTQTMFSIDELTGELRALEPLDYEQAKSHSLLVKARDAGENPRSTTVGVLIRVIDVQDEAPFFERTHLEARVAENMANHRLVQVQARDLDSVSEITYVLKSGDPSLFQVDPQTGVVSTTERGLDYEESRVHTLLIGTVESNVALDSINNDLMLLQLAKNSSHQQQQVDDSTIQRSPVCRLDVQVTDLNDHAPVFRPAQPLPVRVQDSAQLGALVARLLAEDGDASEQNNQLRYELVTRENMLVGVESDFTRNEKCANWFMVDATSGAVAVKSDLKRDTQSECHLVVRARDSGSQPSSLSSITQLTVFIDHIAEISPASQIAFADTTFTIELDENLPARSLVKVLPIINKPKGSVNYPLNCEIITGNELGKFSIEVNEARDCELRIRDHQQIDYELKQRFMLTIRLNTIGSSTSSLSSVGSGLLNSQSPGGASVVARTIAQVNVNIIDKNDNRPAFHQPSRYIHLTQGKFLAALATDAPSDTQVIQLRATDADSSHSNGLISYEILNDNELENRFKIDHVDGIVRNSRPVEDIPSTRLPLKLRVMARDNPELAADTLDSIVEVVINLIDDRHRIALVLKDTTTGRALDSKEELLG